MNVPYYKTKKRTRPFVRQKSGSFKNHENVFLPILQFRMDFYGNLKTQDVKKGVDIKVQVHDYNSWKPEVLKISGSFNNYIWK